MKTEVNSFSVGEGMLSLTKKLSDTLSLLELLKRGKRPSVHPVPSSISSFMSLHHIRVHN